MENSRVGNRPKKQIGRQKVFRSADERVMPFVVWCSYASPKLVLTSVILVKRDPPVQLLDLAGLVTWQGPPLRLRDCVFAHQSFGVLTNELGGGRIRGPGLSHRILGCRFDDPDP